MREKEITPLSSNDQVYAKKLLRELDGAIRKTVRSYLGSELSFEFEDIVQNVYESICLQLDDFKRCANQEALAVTIASRAVWRVRRNYKPTNDLPEDIPAAESARGLEDIFPASISDMDREILTSAYERKDTMAELAADLGCSAPTLRQRLRRARARLRKALEEGS